jgi:hypothetical protein
MRRYLISSLMLCSIALSAPASACSSSKLALDWCGAAPTPQAAPFVYKPTYEKPAQVPIPTWVPGPAQHLRPVVATDSRGQQHYGLGVTSKY